MMESIGSISTEPYSREVIMFPDHFVAMQPVILLVYAFLAGLGWDFGRWVATKIHK
jgi:hypothetical protein